MEYEVEEREVKREAMRPAYLWVPSILSFVVIVLLLILKVVGVVGAGWGWVVLWWVVVLIVSFGVSIAIWLLVSMKDVGPSERAYNLRGQCDHLLRQEIRRRTGYNLSDFTETGDSVEGIGWFGAGQSEKDQDKIYYHLYRIKRGQFNRYLLGVMNSEKGKEDMVIIKQSPMNFNDVDRLIEETCNRLCRNPVRRVTREKIYSDEVSGRSRIEREESPLDQPENQDEMLEEQP